MIFRRALHYAVPRRAITPFKMPAMSPTMTQGGIANWKVSEGQSFSAGDVLLEIETDKATIDVEASEDGILGKILSNDGTKDVPVGKTIALLAEQGDDISNIEIPAEDSAPPPPKPESSSSSAPPLSPPKPSSAPGHVEHGGRMFPSVHRLLAAHGVNTKSIKPTGKHGMLTKGDVLAFLGQASAPSGTYKEDTRTPAALATLTAGPASAPVKVKPLDATEIRRLIIEGMQQTSKRPPLVPPTPQTLTFDSILADYDPSLAAPPPAKTSPKNASGGLILPPQTTPPSAKDASYLDGLF